MQHSFGVILFNFLLVGALCAQVPFQRNLFTSWSGTPINIYSIDLDKDGDMDVLSASSKIPIYGSRGTRGEISWQENDGHESFTNHTISTPSSAEYVYATDIDEDGDIDVLSASWKDSTIAWHENNGSEMFTEHTISTTVLGANFVYALDFDKDGDMDVLSTSYLDSKLSWYENDGKENFIEHLIGKAGSPTQILAVDLDGDNDIDVIPSKWGSFSWYENEGNQKFSRRRIDASGIVTSSAFTVDMDKDGDLDLLRTSDKQIFWYENDGSGSFTKYDVAWFRDGVQYTTAADIDSDGDMDVLSYSRGLIFWHSNDGNQNFTPTQRNGWESNLIGSLGQGIPFMQVVDFDNDGDEDILTSSPRAVWLKNDDSFNWKTAYPQDK